MLKRKLGQFGLMAVAPAVLLASATAARAAYGVAGTSSLVVDTFDNAASFTNNEVNGGPAGTNWYDGFNPPPPNIRFDYGSATAAATHTVTYSSSNSTDTHLGGAGSGSVKLAWNWNVTADGDGSAAFTMDIQNTAQSYTSVSFDMMIDPSGTDAGHAGFTNYGYFQFFSLDQGYNPHEGSGGPEGAALGNVPGDDPNSGLADTGTVDSSYGAGVWERFTINLTGSGKNVRAIRFQDYSQGVSGPQALYLDNITLNSATPIPEPASLGLLALAGSSMLMRRRRQV